MKFIDVLWGSRRRRVPSRSELIERIEAYGRVTPPSHPARQVRATPVNPPIRKER